jgi:putative phosphoribosyl transferase
MTCRLVLAPEIAGDTGRREASSWMFQDRHDAGRRLGEALLRFAALDPVVLALVRGGVPIGFEVAQALRAPLDVILVRKIGAPYQPELAIGAVVDGKEPEVVTNADLVQALQVSSDYLRDAAREALVEIDRRRAVFTRGRARVDPKGKTAIVVDDGIATGATMRAALHAVRRLGPARLVLAVPVAPSDALVALSADADEVVCLAEPEFFAAIGAFYADFGQLTDRDVVDLLDRAPMVARGPGQHAAEGPQP